MCQIFLSNRETEYIPNNTAPEICAKLSNECGICRSIIYCLYGSSGEDNFTSSGCWRWDSGEYRDPFGSTIVCLPGDFHLENTQVELWAEW